MLDCLISINLQNGSYTCAWYYTSNEPKMTEKRAFVLKKSKEKA